MSGPLDAPTPGPGGAPRPGREKFGRAAATDRAGASSTGPTEGPGDLELVRRTLDGDRDATHTFVDRMVCIPRFLRRLDRRYGTPIGDDGLADLAQEAAARVWRDRERFSGTSRLESWVFGYARHVYLETVASWRERNGRVGELDPVAEQHADPAARDADSVDRQLDAQTILDIVDRLPERESAVIRSKLLEGHTFSAIARNRGEDVNAVKTRYYRALDRIRENLDARPGERDQRP